MSKNYLLSPNHPPSTWTFSRFFALCMFWVGCCTILTGITQAQSSATPATNTWTGGTINWNTPSNWDQNRVPLSTDNVVIPSGTPNQPTLSSAASASTVEVQTGASLSITNAGSLTVNGTKDVSGSTTTFYNGGTVTSGGRLIITASMGLFGLWNVGSFSNTTDGYITIDQAADNGLRNEPGSSFVNSGTILIGSVASVGAWGLLNRASFINSGYITIDRAIDRGLVNELNTDPVVSFTNSGTLLIGSVASVGGSGLWNDMLFRNATGGYITIDRANDNGLRNELGPGSSFVNSATLLIGSVASGGGSGLWNVSSFSNTSGGYITIDRSSLVGLNSDPGISSGSPPGSFATFVNSGTLTIGASETVGKWALNNASSFSNTTGGYITLDRASEQGLRNDLGSPGSTPASFVNSSTLLIGSVENVGDFGLYNAQSFSNTAGGYITIDRAADNGLRNEPGSSFVNSGTILIGSVASVGAWGLLNRASFSNTGGYITIDRARDRGLVSEFNSGIGSGVAGFVNSGTILIGSVADVGLYGLWNDLSFSNTVGGYITIDRSTEVGLNNDPGDSDPRSVASFVNSSTIIIGASATVGSYGLWNAKSFSNTVGGYISIDRSSFMGLNNFPDSENPSNIASFVNSGTLTIGASETVGDYGLYNAQSFSNTSGGYLTLDRTSIMGLYNSYGSFVNSATITIGSVASVGPIGLWNDSSFSNTVGGSITLEQASGTGLYNVPADLSDPNAPFGSLVNSGTITFGTSLTSSIDNQPDCSIDNQGCAALLQSLGDGIITNAGSFSNTGTIIESSTGDSNISFNGGLVQNRNGGIFAIDLGNPPLSMSATDATTCNPANGSFTLTGLQPHTAYTLSYTVAGNATTLNPTSNTAGQIAVTDLAGGTYALLLSGACVAQPLPLSTSLSGAAPLSVTITVDPGLTITSGGSVTLTALGASSYTWSNGSIANPLVVSSVTSATVFSVTGLAGGCSATASATISIQQPCASLPTVTIAFPASASVNPVGPVVTVPVGQGLSYQVFGGGNNGRYERKIVIDRINGFEIRTVTENRDGVFLIDKAGPYSIKVTDANGCSRTVSGELVNAPVR